MDNHLNTGNQSEDNELQAKFDDNHGMFDLDDNKLKETSSESEYDKITGQRSWSSEPSLHISKLESDGVVSVFDVAAYILRKLGSISTMKLQKIVYYCQAWSLVWDEKPLFKEPIEAWANGPVVKELFAHHRGMFQISSIPIGNIDLLDDNQKETIDSVIEYYGDKPSQWLIDLTHAEEPWKKTRAGLPISVRSNNVISLEDMVEYYSSLPTS